MEQCLCSVKKSINSLAIEVIVVDNCSNDDSINYLQPRFPWVTFVANENNVGFAKANNQALDICKGKYILYLNPDTIVPEDCFEKCLHFFENNQSCGALGVRMVDGSGTFLPESKRGFPSPAASFFKLTGLAELFKHSKFFNQYALGYLDEFSNHQVDVLAGAFLMARKTIIDQTKGFDEAFFMYGEDIDLSYQVQQLGYLNYYFSECSILHFKGESTKKGSLNYVKMFYKAMSIFVEKHYSGSKAGFFRLFIQIAIVLRACLSVVKTLIVKSGLPLLDASLTFGALLAIRNFWIEQIRHGKPFAPDEFYIIFSVFTLIFLLSGALSGMYDKLDKPSTTFSASISGIIVMLAAYSLMPEHMRFSRAVVVFGGISAAFAITLFRYLLIAFNWIEPSDKEYKFQQTAVVGTPAEYEKVEALFKHSGIEERLLGRINVSENELTFYQKEKPSIGNIKDTKVLIEKLNIKELIFCEGHLSYFLIIQMIQTLPKNVSYRFMGRGSQSIVGSDSKATAGETLASEGFYHINEPYHKRMKRAIDVVVSLALISIWPVHFFWANNGWGICKNMFKVLFDQATWVGYTQKEPILPKLKPSIITCYGLPNDSLHPLNQEAKHHLNIQYAKNYNYRTDFRLILRNYKQLGG